MIKALLILTSLVTAAAIYYGVQNMNTFKEERAARNTASATLATVQSELNATGAELEDYGSRLTTQTEQRDLASARREQNETKLNLSKQELARKQQDQQTKQRRIDELKIALESNENIPAGLDLEEVPGMIDELKVKEDELQNAIQEKRTLVAAAVNRVKNSEKILESLVQQEADYQKAIARNALELVVSAVNNDWGFVVINTPRNAGIQQGAALIVKRANERVARLVVDKVEATQIVANIDDAAIRPGVRIMPGDQVIFEKPQE